VALREHVERFIQLLTESKSLDAMEEYYADDVCVFENRALARAGKQRCLAHEREQLEQQPEPLRVKLLRYAVEPSAADPDGGHAFVEYTIRFFHPGGRAMRVEEVAVSVWERGRVVQERFYYDGVVDEGDPD
jgi:ketosteroid isomerase-like protein